MVKKAIVYLIMLCISFSLIPQNIFAEPQHTAYTQNTKQDNGSVDSYTFDIDKEDEYIPTTRSGNQKYWYELPQNAVIAEHDKQKIVNFMEAVGSNGKKNGIQMDASYSPSNPRTWTGVQFYKPNNEDAYFIFEIRFSSHSLNMMKHFQDNPVPFLNLGGELDFSGCQYLSGVFCNTVYDTIKYDRTDFSNCANLKRLYLKKNDLGYFNIDGSPQIDEIELKNCGLRELDVSGLELITQLDCSNSPITSINIDGCKLLYMLNAENCLLSHIDISTAESLEVIDLSGNKFASTNDFYCAKQRLMSIDISDNPIVDMLDVSEYTSLKTLYCNNCDLRELYLPKSNTELAVMANGNMLTKLDLHSCPGLTSLNVDSNYLTSIDLSDCAKIQGLSCRNNFLTEIKFGIGVGFTGLRCSNNNLTKLEIPAAFEWFHLLECDNNKLTELDLSAFRHIALLNCSNNYIEKLNLSGQVATPREDGDARFTRFDCSGNPIKEINYLPVKKDDQEIRINVNSMGGGYPVHIMEEQNGKFVGCLLAVPVQGCSFSGWYSGQELVSSNAKITVSTLTKYNLTAKFTGNRPSTFTPPYTPFDFTRVVYEGTLPTDMTYNENDIAKVREFAEQKDAQGKTNGEKLMADYAQAAPEDWTFVKWEVVNDEIRITAIYLDADIDNVTHEYIPENNRYKLSGTLDVTGMDALTAVFADNSGIFAFNAENSKTLKYVAMNNNSSLATVNITGCSEIRYCDLEGNALTSIDVKNLKKLGWLDVSHNKLTKLEDLDKTGIAVLYCGHNSLTELNVNSIKDLNSLSCENNKIAKLDAKNCTALRVLYCMENGMTELTIPEDKALMVLDCSNNKLKTAVLPTSAIIARYDNNEITSFGDEPVKVPNLAVFTCSHNKVKSLNLEKCSTLGMLDISHNEFEEFTFWGDNPTMGVLNYFDCSDNKLKELKLPTPVGIGLLNYLDCSGNQISELDLTHAGANMYYLNVKGNPIKHLKNAPMRYITEQPIAVYTPEDLRLQINVQGDGTINYNLEEITVISGDNDLYLGMYDEKAELITNSKILSTRDRLAGDVWIIFGIKGDANLDGKINTADAVTILRHSTDMITLTPPQMVLADADKNGKVDTADAVKVLRVVAGMETI